MRTTKFLNAISLIATMAISFTMYSCKPDEPENEGNHKLHEDPVKAIFTLTEGKLNNGKNIDNYPTLADFTPTNNNTQVIIWQATQKKGWNITSKQSEFNVKNSIQNQNIVYHLKIDYYNAKGEKINNQFYEQGQDKIHQHFFSIYKKMSVGGSEGFVREQNKSKLPFNYAYADIFNGTNIGKENPLGFDGLIQFIKPGEKFNLSVELLHAARSKYTNNNSTSPFYLPAKVLLSTGQWDIIVKLPINVDGKSENKNILDETLFNPERVEIQIYEGHLHGPLHFHQNPQATQNKCIGRSYKLIYHLKNNTWIPDTNNPKIVNVIGSKQEFGVTAFAIRYFDNKGKDITSEIVENNQDSHYQHFFQVSNIQPSYGGKADNTDVNSTLFFDYKYCDTYPWNKSNKFDNAEFVGTANPIGIKGYFNFKSTHKKFILNIKLMRARKSKFLNNKNTSPFYLPSKEQTKSEAWMPSIKVPMNVYMDVEDKTIDINWDQIDLSKPTIDDNLFSKYDKEKIYALMHAFELKTFTEAVAEFYWNENGDAKEDNNGFWF